MTLQLIDRTTGTNIGDMTLNGGLAAAFDGVTAQAHGACAAGNTTGPVDKYVGKTLASPKRFGQAVVYGSNSQGYAGSTPPINLTMRGKNGAAPSGPTDGTSLGTINFTDTTDESVGRVIASTDLNTVWDHIFLVVNDSASESNVYVAELELFAYVISGINAGML
jgi:hypothetical protein